VNKTWAPLLNSGRSDSFVNSLLSVFTLDICSPIFTPKSTKLCGTTVAWAGGLGVDEEGCCAPDAGGFGEAGCCAPDAGGFCLLSIFSFCNCSPTFLSSSRIFWPKLWLEIAINAHPAIDRIWINLKKYL